MVRELGLDAAKAGLVASALVHATRTVAANRIGVKFFIPEFLVFERGMGRDRPRRSVFAGAGSGTA
jgi:hypothetical protein